MLQPSHFPNYLQFLGSTLLLSVIFIAIFFWAMRRAISNMQKSPEFTHLEVDAVRGQMLALLVGTPLVLMFVVLAPLLWEQPSSDMVFIGLILGFAPLAYIAVSAIRNRVLIGGRSLPIKGTRAARSGVINLVLVILMFIGSVIFFASQFALLK
jgi:hypothetical protein